jgi:hypothetical protein
LESAGEKKDAEGTDLYRAVKLEAADEKWDFVLMILDLRRCR